MSYKRVGGIKVQIGFLIAKAKINVFMQPPILLFKIEGIANNIN